MLVADISFYRWRGGGEYMVRKINKFVRIIKICLHYYDCSENKVCYI